MSDTTHAAGSSDQGSFVTGFTIGLFAGAAGYFLFGTDRGKKLKKQIASEWQTAQSTVHTQQPNESGLASTLPSIREFVKNVINSAMEMGEAKKASANKTAKSASKETSKEAPRAKKTTFKGI